MSSSPPPFLFVVGCGRSGTTLLRTILDGHPELAVAHEARFVAPFGMRRKRYERPEGFDVDRFVADLLNNRAARSNLDLDESWLRRAVIGDTLVAGYPDAVRRVFAAYAARRGRRRYGDKMPGYVLRLPVLAGLFPEGRFVHIVRDGRDVALSNLAIAGPDHDPATLAIDWKRRVTAGRRAGADLGPERYREVRYEHLVASPEPIVAELCTFLDLRFDEGMLRYFERPASIPTKVQRNPRHARLADPVSTGPRSWRTHMPARDREVFEAVAGELLTELGYECSGPATSTPVRARASWAAMRWQAHRARTRLPRYIRRSLRGS